MTGFLKKSGARTSRISADDTGTEIEDLALEQFDDACRLYFESTSDVIYAYDNQFRVRYVSPSVERVLGFTVDEVVGRTFPEIGVLAPESLAIAVRDAAQVLDGHDVETEEYVFLTKGGERRIGEVSGTKLIEDGRVKLIVSVARDITARKRVEAERFASESNYRVLFRQSPVGVLSFDTDLVITDVNDQFLRTMKTTRELVIGFDMHEVEDAQVIAYFESALRGELGHYEGRYRATTSDADLWIYANSAPLRDVEGRVIGGIAAIEDITEQKRVEDALRKSEEIHRALFQQSLLGVFTYDTGLHVTDCNDRLLEKIDATRDQAIGFDLNGIDDRSFLPALEKVFGGKAGTYEGPYSTTFGNHRYVMFLLATPLTDADGSVIGGIAAIEDITAQTEAQKELRRYSEGLEDLVNERTRQLETSVAELRALNDELEAFSYSVSHDLRVPLRAISGLTRMLLDERGERLDEEGRRQMGLVVESTERMSGLIEDLLVLSRTGRNDMRWARIDMEQLSNEVIDELRLDLDGRDLRFALESLPPAWGDVALVRQVLTNIVENSIKFTRMTADSVVEIGGSTDGDKNTYYVRDNGAGFDMNYADKLFGVFQRLHATEEFEGTGVGLALVQRIVHRHGGRVWAEGVPGGGATFYFTLPRPECA